MDRQAVAEIVEEDADEVWPPPWEPVVDWKPHIHQDPDILVGKPVVRGTRLSAEFLLELYAVGWSEDQVLESYPHLTKDALRAVFAFAAQCVRERYPVIWPEWAERRD